MRTSAKVAVIGVLLTTVLLAAAPAGEGSPAAPPPCRVSEFKLSRGPGASALAHFRQTVRLRNVSSTTCAMSGWFKIKLLNAQGAALPSHEQRITSDMFGTSPKPKLVVKPGAGASFAIDTTAPATSCPFSEAIAVTPPGGHGSKRLTLSVQACPSFSVLPVQPDNKAIHP
jgi:hypothetical protein